MDLATLIVDLLRKKEEEQAANNGGPIATAGHTPTPGMLGSGGAAMAAEALLRKQSTPMQTVDSLQ